MIPKTILVPLDGSDLAERSVPIAASLAERLGATVALVSATYGNERATRDYLDHVATLANRRDFDQANRRDFDKIVAADIEPADVILNSARELPDPIICMTTHGRGRLRWAVAGSVAEEVIQRATGPLLLVGPRGEETWSRPARRVVVCVDGTDAGRAATRHACEWATALGLEVQLVFATHPLDVEDSEHPEKVFAPSEEIVRASGLEAHRTQLFRSSFVGGALADFAEDPPATLMVMAAHHHSALARAALGSTTMSVLNVSSCPVLVVPPGET